ncbi:hypothetical protein DMB42_11140 [Nonomuraea sp. WAC 01424]|uniref:hypothetical protein n=1 Tax=Nonomuraea sp. WAC 01424 TaxID=2203200 RepID=UPI000F76EED0|nr:hypothetical protein [Nonomuraea sp. WAC 01424]RSN12733.1 hypothetical protein DMB42_11140 [Nonomuraea sp. WAC 01424]
MAKNGKSGNRAGRAPHVWSIRRKWATAIVGMATTLVGLPGVVVRYGQAQGEGQPARLAITAPATGPGASAPPCPLVRGTATLPEGTTLLVGVRRTTGTPRTRLTRFYRVDTVRPSGQWDVPVSLEGDDPAMAGEWYSITALTVPTGWSDFLERVDGTAGELLTTASALPPYEGPAPSIEVQRETSPGFC